MIDATPRRVRWSTLAATFASALLAGGAAWADGPPPGPKVDYNRDVRPILSKNCFACHGQDPEKRAAGLRLDSRDEAVKELKSGAIAVVAGSVDESELIARVTEADESLRMPPRKSGDRLTAAEVDVLRRWVAQGATYAEHWAFVKPIDRPLPPVKAKAWPRNGIDYWVLARLEAEGLAPSPEADRFTLLRRASLDLRGLPPTPAEVARFAADSSADAYEKAVDRFLADSAYGERRARLWLDLARYADSAGYGSDPLRTIWRYRDWVIDAFNRNLPYDQFTIEQIAGDLLPHATLDQKMATAFHRNTMTNTEGGTDDEEFRVAAVKDRVDSTWQIWMGLTMGCAKCHSHKYDPLTNEEYYRFFAVFNQTADTDKPDESPVIPAPTAEQLARNREIDAKIATLRQTLDKPDPALDAARVAWEASLKGKVAWTPLPLETSSGRAGLDSLPDGSLRVAKPGETPEATRSVSLRVEGLSTIAALQLETLPDPALPGKGAGLGPDGAFVLSRVSAELVPARAADRGPVGKIVRIELPGESKYLSLAEVEVFSGGTNVARQGQAKQSSTDFGGDASRAIDGKTDGDFDKARSTSHTAADKDPWWEVTLREPVAVERIAVWNRTDGVGERLSRFKVILLDAERKVVWQTEVAEPPAPSRTLAVSARRSLNFARAAADFTQEGFNAADLLRGKAMPRGGWAVGPKHTEPHNVQLVLSEPLRLTSSEPMRIEVKLETTGKNAAMLGRFRISATDSAGVLRRSGVPEPVLAAVDTPPPSRTKAQTEAIAAYYKTIAPALQKVRDEIARLEKSRPAAPTLPVMVELPAEKRRESKILIKGNFLNPGARVEPGVPRAFPPLPQGAAADRLAIARWLVDPENPLTARVAVNREWATLFGAGIVETEEDFGTQGEPPSHPELLDWLAREYVKRSWDTGPAPVDGHVGHVPAGVAADSRPDREGPAQPAAGARTSVPARGRDRSRPGAGGERPAEPQGGGAVGLPAPAGGALAGRVQRPAHVGDQPWRRQASARPLHVLAADRSLSLDGHVRRPEPRDLLGQTDANQHAVAGVRHDERPGLCRGSPGAGASDRDRRGIDPRGPRTLCASAHAGASRRARGPGRSVAGALSQREGPLRDRPRRGALARDRATRPATQRGRPGRICGLDDRGECPAQPRRRADEGLIRWTTSTRP
ncbi:MAG: DUF1549 domain-containing protein [Isosphaeraceae bacterium]